MPLEISDVAIKKLNKTLSILGRGPYNYQEDSIHWVLFSALSLSLEDAELSILEIGTLDGYFSLILSLLFPKAKITTVELNQDDPIYRETYQRQTSEDLEKFEKIRETFLGAIERSRLRFIRANTLFIDRHLDEVEKFDLFWVDGSHNYPEIAWDIHFCLRRIKKNGYILVDDVKTQKANATALAGTDVYEVIKYITKRIATDVCMYKKREKVSDKYVAVIGPING